MTMSSTAIRVCIGICVVYLWAFSSAQTVQKSIFRVLPTEHHRSSQRQKQQEQSKDDSVEQTATWQLPEAHREKGPSYVYKQTTRVTADLAVSRTAANFISQDKVTMSTLGLFHPESESVTDNLPQSSVQMNDTRDTPVSLTREVSNATIESTGVNVTEESPGQMLENISRGVNETHALSGSQTTRTVPSGLELSRTSPSGAEADTNYTLDMSNVTITFPSQITNMSNSTSDVEEAHNRSSLHPANVSNSTLELIEKNVMPNSQTQTLSKTDAAKLIDFNINSSTQEPGRKHNTTELQDDDASQNHEAESKNTTKESAVHDDSTNTTQGDSKHSTNTQHHMTNQTDRRPSNIPTSSQQTEARSKHLENEDYDYAVDDPSLSHSSEENIEKVLEPGCPTCRMRAIDRHYRILQFKNQILSSLQITAIPNVTGMAIPKVPALTNLYEADVDLMGDSPRGGTRDHTNMADRHHQDDDDDDFVVKTERIFIGAKEAPLALHLNLTDTAYFPPAVRLFTSEIKSAHLWFYIRKHVSPPALVVVELIVPQASSGSFATKKLMSVKLAKHRAHGWKRVDLTRTLRQWVKHPMTNFGLLIKAVDKSGNNLVVMPHPPDVDKGYEPCLDTKIIESKHNSRRRRSESLMCVENSTDTRCCRHPLIVGFAEFGWDWIIAPTHVNADYCTGECRLTMQDNTPYSWVNQQVPGTNSCCTPSKLSPLPLMYFDENMYIVYQILQNMKVDKCGCA